MLYAFFWVIPRRLNFICQLFGTLCSIFLGLTQKKAYIVRQSPWISLGVYTLCNRQKVLNYIATFDRSQWPHGLRRGSASTHLLGLQVRFPPGAWMSVFCECCVLSGRDIFFGQATLSGRPLVQRIPTGCGASECNRKASAMRRSWLI